MASVGPDDRVEAAVLVVAVTLHVPRGPRRAAVWVCVSLRAGDWVGCWRVTGIQSCALLIQAEDGIRDYRVTGVQTCALLFQAEDGIRDYRVTGVQTCALPIQAENGIRYYRVTGVQTCALPIYNLVCRN